MTIASGQQALAADILKAHTADGYLSLTASTELTIASGAVTATANFYRVDTEGDAASDDLDTITAGTGVDDGHLLILRAENAGRTVVLKHNGGNIMCVNGEDYWLDDSHDFAILVYDGNLTKWMVAGLMGPVNVNTGSLAANAVTTAKIADLNVTTGKLATDSVDDTIAGNRVPQFYRRQGGSATNWSTAGTTTRTPTSVRMQGGAINLGSVASFGVVTATVTFPTAFSDVPLIYLTLMSTAGDGITGGWGFASIDDTVLPSTTAFTIFFLNVGNDTDTFGVNWLAIGPE